MSVGKIRASFQKALNSVPNDTLTSKELKAIVAEAKKDDNVFDAAEKAEIAQLTGDAILNNKAAYDAQRTFAKMQATMGIHDTRPQPSWMGNVHTVIERTGEAGRPVSGTITYDNYARQRASVRDLRFEVWEPGMTDRDNPDLWKTFDAKVHFRFAGETQFREAPIEIGKRSGNNVTYRMDLARFDPWFAKYNSQSEVKGINPKVENGAANLECFVTINGKVLRGDGENFRVKFEGSGPIES